MRTTVEITDAQRARLLEIAAARGETGFSSVVREAIDLYLTTRRRRNERIRAALALGGKLAAAEADELEAAARAARARWR